jgi:hypothetical protein
MTLILLILALLAGLSIPTSRAEAGDYTDISGTKLRIKINWWDASDPMLPPKLHDDDAPDDLLPPLDPNAVFSARALRALPLSTIFDLLWSSQTDMNGNKRTSGQEQAKKLLITAIQQNRSKAYNIIPTLPPKGKLFAAAWGDVGPGMADSLPLGTVARQLTLIYRIPGIYVAWTEKTDGLEVGLNLSFDGELQVSIAVPNDPTFPIGALVPQLTRWVGERPPVAYYADKHDWMGPQGVYTAFWMRNVKPGGDTSYSVGKGANDIADWWNSQPDNSDHMPDQDSPVSITDVFGVYDKNGDNELSKLFEGFRPLFQQGFVQLKPSIENNAVVLRLYHPNVDWGPGLKINGSSGVPDFKSPAVNPYTIQTKAGYKLGVNGQNFPPTHAREFRIDWFSSTVSVIRSDIEYVQVSGPKGHPIGKPHTKTLHYHKGDKPTFLASDLTPNTWYRFRVKDSARFSFPPWSEPLYVKTDRSDEVTLYLDYKAKKQMVGHAKLGIDGTFSTSITVPRDVPVGQHQLRAEAPGGNVARTTITVIGANQSPQPILQVIDPNSKMALQNPGVVDKVTLHGEGFPYGTVTFYIDSPQGRTLGTRNADGNGMFTASFNWPTGVYGKHKIVAVQVINGQKIQAVAGVYGQQVIH